MNGGLTPYEEHEAPDARIAELATGFALHELSDAEQHEFLGYLTDPVHGRDAARNAWSTLHTITDLRAEQSHVLQDSVRSRIEASRAAGVTGRLMLRLGLRRGGLKPITEPDAVSVPQAQGRWLLLASVVLMVAGLSIWYLQRRPVTLAHIDGVIGRAVIAGQAIGPGELLDGQPVSVADGACATLRWPDGTLLSLTGPGTVIPQSAGSAVLGGQAVVTARGDWAVGMPDGRARASAGARLVIEVETGRSCLSVFTGQVRMFTGQEGVSAQQPMAIRTCRIGNVDIPWSSTEWNQIPDLVPLPAAPRWNLTFTTKADTTGSLTLRWADGALVDSPEGVVFLRGDGTTQRTVHPPADRHFELEAKPWGFTVSLHDEVLLQATVAPTSLRCQTSGHIMLKAVFRSGPPLLTTQ